jgi:proteasome lid subunit RPN8/RPN11
MILSKAIKEKALAHAKESPEVEVVGVVHIIKGRERYFPCKNIADDPKHFFELCPEDYAKAEELGEITAIIHSHPITNHHPSQADKVACENSGVPWYVVNPQTEKWGHCEPSGFQLGYVGRIFSHGLVDCYSLVKDFYEREFNIELANYYRSDKWWKKGGNLYLENFKNEGFYEIEMEEMRYGDCFLMKLESSVPNHAAVYMGENVVLHHVQGRLSSRDVYGGYYQKVTEYCLRHENR